MSRRAWTCSSLKPWRRLCHLLQSGVQSHLPGGIIPDTGATCRLNRPEATRVNRIEDRQEPEFDHPRAYPRIETVKALVQDKYGSPDVLELRDIDKPIVGDGDLLVRVRAAAVDPGVWHLMTGLPYLVRVMGYGLRAPRVQVRGTDVAGHVAAVGENVTRCSAPATAPLPSTPVLERTGLRRSPQTLPLSRLRPCPPPLSPPSRVFATWERLNRGRRS